MQMEVKEQIERLRNELHRHNYNYYSLNAPEISDKEFDFLMKELEKLAKANNVPFDLVRNIILSVYRNKRLKTKIKRRHIYIKCAVIKRLRVLVVVAD